MIFFLISPKPFKIELLTVRSSINSRSLLKTVVMMAGELEFEDIFFDDGKKEGRKGNLYPVTSHLMFFAFVILATVILTNLLVGLAVSDIQVFLKSSSKNPKMKTGKLFQGLQTSAGLNRLSRQAELVARLEGMLFSKLLKKAPLKITSILLRQALLRTSRWNLQICIKPNDPREKSVRVLILQFTPLKIKLILFPAP